jgi:allantoicase
MSSEITSAAFTGLVDLASRLIGGKAIEASDEFFAEKENLLEYGRGIFIPGRFTDRGKWMDGWETRRKRTPGHDWCIIRLGLPGIVQGIDIDTNHFLGNHPAYASIDACCLEPDQDESALQDAKWTEILSRCPLAPGSQNLFGISSNKSWTHIRLNIYPDGGVARLRVYGLVTPRIPTNSLGEVDLVSMENGGRAVACSDMFFSPMSNLIMPGRAENMGEGWESRRRRGPGNDWVILRTARPGYIKRIEVDTNHFKGNYPDYCTIDACYAPDIYIDALNWPEISWERILDKQKLEAHKQHTFQEELLSDGPFTHVRLNIFPDGGVSRLRVYGRFGKMTLSEINKLNSDECINMLMLCCGSTKWATSLEKQRPFKSKKELFERVDASWDTLKNTDWLEAFSHHPKIGDIDNLRKKFAATRSWAEGEQSGAVKAPEEVLKKLARYNETYLEKYGYIFIVCATGKSATEMLQILEERLNNEPSNELQIAAEEQKKITLIRLEKLLK